MFLALVLELVEGDTIADRIANGAIPQTRRSQSPRRLHKPSKRRTNRASFTGISSLPT